MPIRNCSIISPQEDQTKILLPIRITNPHTKGSIKTFGIIDTGATECAIPAKLATVIGHNLTKGEEKEVNTGNGLTTAYRHTITIEIFHPQLLDNQIIYKLDNVLIDCMPHLFAVLLGVNGFLSNFILNVDYPKRKFSLIQ